MVSFRPLITEISEKGCKNKKCCRNCNKWLIMERFLFFIIIHSILWNVSETFMYHIQFEKLYVEKLYVEERNRPSPPPFF